MELMKLKKQIEDLLQGLFNEHKKNGAHLVEGGKGILMPRKRFEKDANGNFILDDKGEKIEREPYPTAGYGIPVPEAVREAVENVMSALSGTNDYITIYDGKTVIQARKTQRENSFVSEIEATLGQIIKYPPKVNLAVAIPEVALPEVDASQWVLDTTVKAETQVTEQSAGQF